MGGNKSKTKKEVYAYKRQLNHDLKALIDIHELSAVCRTFKATYRELPRDSKSCYNLWKKVVEVDEYLNTYEAILKENFTVRSPKLMKDSMVDHMFNDIHTNHLSKVIQKCTDYLREYIVANMCLSENGITELDEKELAKVVISQRKLNKKWQQLQNKLSTMTEKWKKNLFNSFDDRFNHADNAIRKVHLEPVVCSWNDSIIREFLNEATVLKERNSKPEGENKKLMEKIDYLTEIVEDINGAMEFKSLSRIIEQVKSLLPNSTKVTPATSHEPTEYSQNSNNTGLTSLGPFGITPLKLNRSEKDRFNFDNCFSNLEFHFDANQLLVVGVAEEEEDEDEEADAYEEPATDGNFTLQISPPVEITISNVEERKKIHIPTEAFYFAFVYPCKQEAQFITNVPKGLQDLFDTGGFIYFKSDQSFSSLNCLSSEARHMYFIGPYELPTSLQETFQRLQKANRLQDVTLSALRQLQVKQFAWVNPGEFHRNDHGCFVYTFENNRNSVYFRMTSELEANRANKEDIEQLIEEYRAEF